MVYREASIGDVQGTGIATLGLDYRGMKVCDGLFFAKDFSEAISLSDQRGLKYSGTLIEDSKETFLTFTIIITQIEGNRVRFSALSNPYND